MSLPTSAMSVLPPCAAPAETASARLRSTPPPAAGEMAELDRMTQHGDSGWQAGDAFTAAPDALAFASLVSRVPHATAPVLACTAQALGGVLADARRQDGASSPSATLGLLNVLASGGGPLPALRIGHLLDLLAALGDSRPGLVPAPYALQFWQDCFWAAISRRAAGQARLLHMLVPRLRDEIRRAPLWLELQHRPDALVRMLRHALEGAACVHGAAYAELGGRLEQLLPDRERVAGVLQAMLLEALFDTMPGQLPAGTLLRGQLAEARARRASGEVSAADFDRQIVRLLARLDLASRAVPLPPEQVLRRGALARAGMSGVRGFLPEELLPFAPDGQILSAMALLCAGKLLAVCRAHETGGPTALRQAMAQCGILLLTDTLAQHWSPATSCVPLDAMLGALRIGVWLVGHAGKGVCRVAPLCGARRQAARDGIGDAVDTWLLGLRVDAWLGAASGWETLLSQHWCEVLRRWRREPAAREELLDSASLLLPEGFGCAAGAALASRHAALLELFQRCLSAYAIEGVPRRRLTRSLQLQLERAMAAGLH
ncbi:hypothetical protein GT347_22865 [Xylophilus rhododendri]|uniref:Uncharacterized protein n=1 Tax=Xylophilus rhododendri TaxID=2697032 RepID=A0A857JBV7_9BURK|nr:hypothetical protein [Xylophilus rhododendri]QHJ00570.1 hypothetical protein GT347_22865 [Xylophilus rhododendri]